MANTKNSSKNNKERYIVHMDMDAFFAAVEQRDNPSLIGKPVIIGADPKDGRGRGVVSTCSYEARKYGIHSAMPISQAYRNCPHGIYLPPDMYKYSEISDQILDILETFTPDIEPISIDEAFMDITGSYHLFGTPKKTCEIIKQSIKKITGLTASIGMAPNMMTAKIASDINKPDGLTIVTQESLISFLHPLPVGRLWGVGVKTKHHLQRMGIRTIGDIADCDKIKLEDMFGKSGEHIWELANGIDPRRVEVTDEIKSISNEHTFMQDTKNTEEIKNAVMSLSQKVSRRLRKNKFKARTVTLKIRFSDFNTFTRSHTLSVPTNFVLDIYEEAVKHLKGFPPKKVRLVGVKTSNFAENEWAQDLFTDNLSSTQKSENLHKALDKIKDRFGEGAIGYRGP